MDHLVLHPFGLLIVESKSVSDGVQITDDGQWMRWYNKKPSGMASPVTQAKIQAKLLKELLEKAVKQKGFFDQIQLDVLVAISDGGTITWPKSGALSEVCKADQVPERITQHIEKIRSIRKIPEILTVDFRRTIADFLIKVHKPLVRTAQPISSAVKVAESRSTYAMAAPPKICKHCHSSLLEAKYGQYGYYFYCRACSKNTAIKFSCLACNGEGRIRKDGNNFFAECKVCSASTLFYANSTV
jgi:hypothetical protein